MLRWYPCTGKGFVQRTGLAAWQLSAVMLKRDPISLPLSRGSAVSPVHIAPQRGACRQHGMK